MLEVTAETVDPLGAPSVMRMILFALLEER